MCVFMGGGRVSQSASKWDALQPMSSVHELQSIITESHDRWYQLLCVLNGSLPAAPAALFRQNVLNMYLISLISKIRLSIVWDFMKFWEFGLKQVEKVKEITVIAVCLLHSQKKT